MIAILFTILWSSIAALTPQSYSIGDLLLTSGSDLSDCMVSYQGWLMALVCPSSALEPVYNPSNKDDVLLVTDLNSILDTSLK